ncbi:MAG: hypothetical protein EP344_15810 [Bacteroidetes bacterium]|nr:MAG: hypothetical protein EP344_15810 [Bacteroidota bacterium]
MNGSNPKQVPSGCLHRTRFIWPTWLSPLPFALVAAVLTALVMPHPDPFPYHFEYGYPWNYQTLYAPFDFEVLYPEKQVKPQIDSIRASHAPYYILDPEVARRQKVQLHAFIQERLRVSRHDVQYEDLIHAPGKYEQFGQQILAVLYERGIAGQRLAQLQAEDPGARLYLVRNNSERLIQAAAVATPESAWEFLIDTLPYSPVRQPEILLPVLEQLIEPNVFYNDSLTEAAIRKKIASVVSTGITVRKGETIIQKGELITDEDYRKLDSLSKRLEPPKGVWVYTGYILLAVLGFGFYFFGVRQHDPSLWSNRKALVLGPALVLALLFLLRICNWIGPAVVFLVPVWGIPGLFLRLFRLNTGLLLGGLLILLSTISFEWSATWLAIQMTGVGTLLLLYSPGKKWTRLAVGSALTVLLQGITLGACILAEMVPAGLMTADSLLFLLFGNGILLGIFPAFTSLGRFAGLEVEEAKL